MPRVSCGPRSILSFLRRAALVRSADSGDRRVEYRLQVLIDELSACRTEDSDSLNQMLQAVAVCMTALAAIFAVASGLFAASGFQIDQFTLVACEIITTCILIAGFSYLISLGLLSVLRYHHMRALEVEIRELAGSKGEVGWIELKAACGSLNPKHLYDGAAILHYASLMLTVFGIAIAWSSSCSFSGARTLPSRAFCCSW